jgi:hypothetical protein
VVTGHQLTAGSDAVQVQSAILAVNGISIRDNDITVKGSGAWPTGILLSGNKIHDVSAVAIPRAEWPPASNS